MPEIALGRVISKLPTALRFDSQSVECQKHHLGKGFQMSMFDAARAAREHADACTSPSCHAVANALEGALDASLGAIRDGERERPDLTGITDPPVSNILIANPGTGKCGNSFRCAAAGDRRR